MSNCIEIDEKRQLLILTTPSNGRVPFTFASIEMLYDMIPVKYRQQTEKNTEAPPDL